MLTFPINTTSVQESNIFLRKLWSELNQIKPLGWQMYPYKHDNTVTIGRSTFGEISYDYTRKGCIKNLYIDSQQDEAISKAVQNAKCNGMKSYVISLELKNNKDICISDVSFERIKVFTHANKVYLQCTFDAYSAWDVEMFFPHKFASILSIIYEYTYVLFNIEQIQLCEGNLVVENSEFREYDNRWIDFDECPRSEENALILPCECLRLLSYVIDDKSYDENIELLLNSSNLLTTTQRLLQEIEFPNSSYTADIINSMVCSSLEPLSQILDKSTERCSECGNMIFSITNKIKKIHNGPPVKTTHKKIIVNQIIPYQPILSPEPPWYRSAQRNCPAEQGCLDRLGLAGTMALARCPQLLNPLRTLAAPAQPARTRLSRSVACDAKQLW